MKAPAGVRIQIVFTDHDGDPVENVTIQGTDDDAVAYAQKHGHEIHADMAYFTKIDTRATFDGEDISWSMEVGDLC